MDDIGIIELYLSRSESAISETAKKYGNYLRKISMNILHNKEDSEECVNDTYLNTWKAIPPQMPNTLRVFLGRITRNLSLDRYKRRRAQKRGGDKTELLLSELEECIPSYSNTEKHLEDEEIAKLISDFLHKQSEENRIIFMRRYWYGDSVKQIIERFRFSESKIKSSLFRTRNALKLYLENEEVEL